MRDELHQLLLEAIDLNHPEAPIWIDPSVGWCDGGCFGLAAALYNWSGGVAQPYGLYRIDDDIMDHGLVAISLGESGQVLLLDGDGVSTPRELLARWRSQEMTGPCRLAPISRVRLFGAADADPVVDVEALASRLYDWIGDPNRFDLKPLQARYQEPGRGWISR